MARFLHTMIRVGDLERSVGFYTRMLGMREKRRRDVPEGRYTLAFMGYDGDDAAEIELTYNYGVTDYEPGTAFGHLAVGVPDVAAVCARIREAGFTVSRPPGPVQFGATVIAFVEDPDGTKIELIERPA